MGAREPSVPGESWEPVFINWARHLRTAARPVSSASQKRAMVVSTVRHEQGGPPGGQESILAELGSAEVRESLVERETVRGWRKQEGESLLVHEPEQLLFPQNYLQWILPGFSRQTRQLDIGIIYHEGLAHTAPEAEKAPALLPAAGWSLRQPGGGAEGYESIKVNGVHPSLKDRHPGAPE